jgi:hypothetical protein
MRMTRCDVRPPTPPGAISHAHALVLLPSAMPSSPIGIALLGAGIFAKEGACTHSPIRRAR